MSIKSLALAAVAALSLAAGTAQASPVAEIGLPSATAAAESVQPAGYYYYYTRTYGNCVFRYIYVSNGYRYAYAWRRICY
jgi:hypothetical protein